MPEVRITGVQTFLTQPEKARLFVVKVLTNQPGLYGLGCATFTQRHRAVQAALDRHLAPLAVGRIRLWCWRRGFRLVFGVHGESMAAATVFMLRRIRKCWSGRCCSPAGACDLAADGPAGSGNGVWLTPGPPALRYLEIATCGRSTGSARL